MLLLPTFNARLNPCPMSPAEFTAHDQGRFCGQCQRVVVDFSQSLSPALDLAAARAASPDGRVCGSFKISQVATPASLTRRLKWFLLALVLIVGQGLTAQEALAQVRKASPGKHAAARPRPPAKRAVVKAEEVTTGADMLIEGMLLPPEQMMEHTPPPAPADGVYTYVEQMPEWTPGGGTGSIINCFWNYFNPSQKEIESATAGRVLIEYVVSETGAIINPRIVRSGGSLDAAVLRAIRAMPPLRPGQHHGVPVKVRITMPISCVKPQ
jgi:TonB family protein